MIKGNSSSEEEKNGKLEYLAPNPSDVLFTIEFHNLGIFKLALGDGGGGRPGPAREGGRCIASR